MPTTPILLTATSPLLLTVDWLNLTGFLNSLISLGLGALATWAGVRYWKTYDARQKKIEETAKDKAQWRDGRLQAEKALQDAIKTLKEAIATQRKALEDALNAERQDRVQWQLKREAELASIAGILEESTEAHKMLAVMAANNQNQSGRQDRVETDVRELRDRLNRMQDHITSLASHVK